MNEININEPVWLRLTEEGRRVYRDYYAEYSAAWKKFANSEDAGPTLHEVSGYARFQLWNAMEIFGPHIRITGPIMFETTILLSEPKGDAP